MKKNLYVVAFVVVLGLIVGGYTYYKIPKSYVSIDINPSIELSVNAFNRVVAVKSTNADGQTILKEQNLTGHNISSAVSQLITLVVKNNFIKNDGSTVIAITGLSNNDKVAEQLVEASEKAAASAVNACKLSAVYYKDTSDLSLREQAEGTGLSPGKYKLIRTLQSLDSGVSIEQLKDVNVSEIMNQLKTYLSDASEKGNTGLNAEDMQKIAELVNNRWKQLPENKNQNGDKKGKKDGNGDDQGEHSFNKDNICFEFNEMGAGVGETFYVKLITKTEDGKLLEFNGECEYRFDTSYISYENGQFKALKKGKTKIVAIYKGNEAELNVTIGYQNSKDKNKLFFNMNDLSASLNGSSFFEVLVFENGEKKDVTSQCKFDYDSSAIKVDPVQKRLMGLKIGKTVIKAKYKGMTATANVNVIEKKESEKDISAEISRAENVAKLARDYGVNIAGLPIDEAEQKVREAIAAWQGVDITGLSPAEADALLAKTKNNQMTAEGILFQKIAGLLGLNSNAITPVMKKEVGAKLGINFDGMTLEEETKEIQSALAKLGLSLP